MSEVLSRNQAPRGRGSARGGRGGYSSRGGRGGTRSGRVDADSTSTPTSFEDEGDIGQLKKKYASDLPTLKELFPDWTDEDLVFALEDANGVLESAIEHISEGNASQWGEVKKKTADKSRSKPKDAPKAHAATETGPAAARGGRGRGGFEARGGRARGDRGRGGRGGRAGAQGNGVRGEKPATATESIDTSASTVAPTTTEGASSKPVATTEEATEPAESTKEAPKAPEPAKKGWASLFAKPTPPPPQKKTPTAAPAPAAPAEPTVESQPAAPATTLPTPAVPEPPQEKAPVQAPVPAVPEIPSSVSLEAPGDDLTKTNLAQVPDVSVPPATVTAASTVASVQDPSSLPPVTPQNRNNASGYAASAFKATASQGRSASFQRRVLEQQEAVVMPANHAVDRAAVQFGSMGLNGNDSTDIDDQRENAETRAQPPQHSPVAPRASFPPPQVQQPSAETPTVARPAPGLPPVPQAVSSDAASFNDFSRYTDAQKPFDPFTQQTTPAQTQEPFSHQAPAQAAATTGGDYSPFYAADQQRLPYNYYGYPSGDSTAQRGTAGFGVSGAEGQPQIPATQAPGRYGQAEAPGSGHNTPNPTLPATTQSQQPSAQHIPGGQGGHAGYGYAYPYYSNPHYAQSYMNMTQHQYGRNRPMYDDARRYEDHYMPHNNQYGYGNQYAPYGKGGMYGQPFSYDHSSSPANVGGFNQGLPARDSAYGRTGSAQPENQPSTAASNAAFGSGVPDVFGRSQSGFGQNHQLSQQPVSSEEPSKSFETTKTGGPSPSLGQANRPGSATNSIPGQPQSQSALPPLQGQQGQQGGFGGYPQLNHQYGGGLGGLGGHQAGGVTQNHHQASAYGNYGAAGFGNYYGNSGRGGWGGNYGH
ncbi:RNA polymerase II degradation factor 1 [Talaromyces islandicus]|uniref:RNA polymerase II degradation factor 1 n=1 Tax=Talaromyces islandicus TaxID=28573 RepID=A0A0U1LTI7_TALIS|nr:RNA polymerase II degradation factor 1 [Talaromyces islandicus]